MKTVEVKMIRDEVGDPCLIAEGMCYPFFDSQLEDYYFNPAQAIAQGFPYCGHAVTKEELATAVEQTWTFEVDS